MAAALLAGTASCGEREAEPRRWNVVLVVADSLRADHLAASGYPRDTAPNLEALGEDGLLFRDVRAQSGCTDPSIHSLLTSRYPQPLLAERSDGRALPPSAPSVARILTDAGYVSVAVSGSSVVRDKPLSSATLPGFRSGFSEFYDSCFSAHGAAECITDRALRLIDRLEKPFFLYLHYNDPQWPYQPPVNHPRSFAARSYEKEWIADGKLQPLQRMLYAQGPPVDLTAADRAAVVDLYDDEILYLDGQLGRLIERLERDGLAERTLIAVAADHGEELLDHGHLRCSGLLFDSVLRVPMVLRIPGVGRTGEVVGLVQNLDVVPTLLDYLGIDAGSVVFDGRSLRPLIEADRAVNRHAFAFQPHARSVTDGRFKLVYETRPHRVRLFDLEADPREQTDVAGRRPQVVAELAESLAAWIESQEGRPNAVSLRQRAEER